jgi:hypothetical protein
MQMPTKRLCNKPRKPMARWSYPSKSSERGLGKGVATRPLRFLVTIKPRSSYHFARGV